MKPFHRNARAFARSMTCTDTQFDKPISREFDEEHAATHIQHCWLRARSRRLDDLWIVIHELRELMLSKLCENPYLEPVFDGDDDIMNCLDNRCLENASLFWGKNFK